LTAQGAEAIRPQKEENKMQVATFNAQCPVEIGDKIQDANTGRVATITDIACIYCVKAGIIEFRYELDGSGQYIGIKFPERKNNLPLHGLKN
jgi:hypothetical protein